VSSTPRAPLVAPEFGVSLFPYGRGVPIQLTSSGEPVTVYVVRVAPGAPRPNDADFVKVGKSPITIELPNGNYLVETEGFDSTRGAFDLVVDGQPRQLMVETGSQNTHTLGNVATAVGIAAVLGGIAVLVGGSVSQSSTIDKPAIVIPLFASGGVLIGAGITMILVSGTDIEDTSPGRGPDGRPTRAGQAAAGGQFVRLELRGSF
jgi:hypothetical protein